MNKLTVSGDALILAAVITYFGPFGPDVRIDLLNKWHDLCLHGNIDSTLRDPRGPLATDSDKITLDIPRALIIPMDKHLPNAFARATEAEWCGEQCVSPGSIVKLLLWGYRGVWAPRWPLLADMQQHKEFRLECIGEYVFPGTIQSKKIHLSAV